MANFILNSTSTRAVKLSDVTLVEIGHIPPGVDLDGNIQYSAYALKVKLGDSPTVIFETGDTVEAVQALAAPLLAELET